jgi:hypothetical protein
MLLVCERLGELFGQVELVDAQVLAPNFTVLVNRLNLIQLLGRVGKRDA